MCAINFKQVFLSMKITWSYDKEKPIYHVQYFHLKLKYVFLFKSCARCMYFQNCYIYLVHTCSLITLIVLHAVLLINYVCPAIAWHAPGHNNHTFPSNHHPTVLT